MKNVDVKKLRGTILSGYLQTSHEGALPGREHVPLFPWLWMLFLLITVPRTKVMVSRLWTSKEEPIISVTHYHRSFQKGVIGSGTPGLNSLLLSFYPVGGGQ